MLVVDVLNRGPELEAGLAYQTILFVVVPGLQLPVQQQFQALGERQLVAVTSKDGLDVFQAVQTRSIGDAAAGIQALLGYSRVRLSNPRQAR